MKTKFDQPKKLATHGKNYSHSVVFGNRNVMKWVSFTVLFLLIALSASTQSLPVLNPGFELPANGQKIEDINNVPGWHCDSIDSGTGRERGIYGMSAFTNRNIKPIYQTVDKISSDAVSYEFSFSTQIAWNGVSTDVPFAVAYFYHYAAGSDIKKKTLIDTTAFPFTVNTNHGSDLSRFTATLNVPTSAPYAGDSLVIGLAVMPPLAGGDINMLAYFDSIVVEKTTVPKTYIIVYNLNTSGIETGTLDHPYKTIQGGIDAAIARDTVLVFPGTYVENVTINNKNIVIGSLFLITKDTSNISTTIIDGNKNGTVLNISNCNTLYIIGFVIKNGNGQTGGVNSSNSKIILDHLKIVNNIGIVCGGIRGDGFTIHNSLIAFNSGGNSGGISLGTGSINYIINSEILNNYSPTVGSGIFAENCNLNLYNSIIAKNHGTSCLTYSSSTGSVINCTITDNPDGSLGIDNSQIQIRNCIEWNNNKIKYGILDDIQYSLIEGGASGKGNIDVNPIFVDTAKGDYHLLPTSPCLNAGTPDTAKLNLGLFDLDGKPRVAFGRIDMGAYESVVPYLPPFTEQTQVLPNYWMGAAALGDYDNDGFLDILISGFTDNTQITKVYHNNGNGTFIEQTSIKLTAVGGSSVAWGDYDNDGYLDIALSGTLNNGYKNSIFKIYHNNRDGIFTEQVSFPGVFNCSIAWGDYDKDGYLDILLTGNGISKIYHNNGNGNFTEQTGILLTGVDGSSIGWGDYDNDGFLDILVAGNNSQAGNISNIYHNNGKGSFTKQSGIILTGVNNGYVAWGDYDNDGYLDILLTGLDNSKKAVSKIYHNNGKGNFTEQTDISLTGVYYSSVAWGDYDNDGYLDIIISGNNDNKNLITKIYHNNGNGSFSEIAYFPFSGASAWADIDNDGKLDFLANSNIYKNNSFSKNYAPLSEAPYGLHAVQNENNIRLTWNEVFKNYPLEKGFSYNVFISQNNEQLYNMSCMANIKNGIRNIPEIGNAQLDTFKFVTGLAQGKYTWGVQAIDMSYRSSLFALDSFIISDKKLHINDISACIGDSITFSLTNFNNSNNYLWYQDGKLLNEKYLSTINVKVLNGISYTVKDVTNNLISEPVKITWNSRPNDTLPKIYAGGGPNVYYYATDAKADHYQWYRNDTAILGANKYYYVANKIEGNYYVKINQNDKECPAFSKTDTLVIPNSGNRKADIIFNLTLYPNPVKNELFISISGNGEGEISYSISDLTGRLLKTAYASKMEPMIILNVSTSFLGAGNYMLTVKLNKITTKQLMFIKQ